MTSIRTAKLTDLPDIEKIVHDAVQHMRAHNIDQWDAIYPDRGTLETDIRRQEMSVLVSGDKICGFITVNDEESPEYAGVGWDVTGKVRVIHRLTVAPGCQSRGIARKLMRHAEAAAVDIGCDAIRLDAFADNPRALKLYEQLGYRKAGMVTFRKGRFFCYEKGIEAGQG